MEGKIRGALAIRSTHSGNFSAATSLVLGLWVLYKVICVSFASYLLPTLTGNAISAKASGWYSVYVQRRCIKPIDDASIDRWVL